MFGKLTQFYESRSYLNSVYWNVSETRREMQSFVREYINFSTHLFNIFCESRHKINEVIQCFSTERESWWPAELYGGCRLPQEMCPLWIYSPQISGVLSLLSLSRAVSPASGVLWAHECAIAPHNATKKQDLMCNSRVLRYRIVMGSRQGCHKHGVRPSAC